MPLSHASGKHSSAPPVFKPATHPLSNGLAASLGTAPEVGVNPNQGGTATVDQPGPGGHILTVGAGGEFSNLSDAIAAAHDNDVIAVKAGRYVDQMTDAHKNIVFAKNVTIEGVGGLARLTMGAQGIINGKALIVAENGLTLKNFELYGATDGSSYNNLAGVRVEGGDFTVSNSYIHDNQAGILGGVPGGTFLVDHCEVADNGDGSGYTHNIYTGNLASLTVSNSYIHGARVGHEIKSRAEVTTIINNVIANGPTGTASYDIDIPNAGVAVIRNNIIEKGPLASNAGIIHYGGETQFSFSTNSLDISNNIILNDTGPTNAWAVWNHSATNGLNVTSNLTGNRIYGLGPNNLGTGPLNATRNVTLQTETKYSKARPWVNAPVIQPPAGPLSLALTNYGNHVSGGAVALAITDLSGGNFIDSGTGVGITLAELGGSSLITTRVATSNTIDLRGDRSMLISNGQDTISIEGIYNTVIASGASVITSSNFGSFTLNGAETLICNTPSNVVIGSSAAARVVAAGQYLQISKWAGGSLTLTDTAAAVRARATVSGGKASVFADATGITLTATDRAAHTVTFGSGRTTVNGGDGADTYVFVAGQGGGTAVINNFQVGIDQLSFRGFAGSVVTQGTLASGATVLELSDGTSVRLGAVSLADYVAGRTAGVSGVVTLTTTNNVIEGNDAQLRVSDLAGGNSIRGGSGGLEADIAGSGSTVSTMDGSRNTIAVAYQASVTSAGVDSITISGQGNAIVASGVASVMLGFYGNSVIGGAGALTLVDNGGGNAITGGSGGLRAAVNGVESSITTLAGSSNTISVSGRSRVISAGDDRITLAGNYNWVSARGATTIDVAAGSFDTITLNGIETLNDAGGGFVILGAGARATVNASVGYVAITKAAGATLVLTQQTGADPAVARISGGAAQVTGNDGANGRITVATDASGGADITLGSGQARVTSLGDDTIAGGSGTVTITASGVAGTTMSFLGGSGTATLVAGAGTLSATAGSGALALTFGAGSTTLAIGSGAADLLRFSAAVGGGVDMISGYRAGIDQVQLEGVSIQSQTVSGGNLALLLSDGTKATFLGVSHL